MLLKIVNSSFNYGKRKFSTFKWQFQKHSSIDKIRNIGIMAHIDAGKTTTTERMLYYSGRITNMGEVHHGNTVTDFMEQERRRGITITSASVTFPWGDYSINLIDTPGHIDFTMEVEQTLAVMDGAVIVLDASAGVEAQTLTVWRQAGRFKIPCIMYINKMDRPDAAFHLCIQSIKNKLHAVPLIVHLPYVEGKHFKGIIDLLKMELNRWDENSLGVNVSNRPIVAEDGAIYEEAINARRSLTEALADFDDELAEEIVRDDLNLESVLAQRLRESLRKLTISNLGVPVTCGSSYKNIGVQALMDAVTMYLPSPVQRLQDDFVKSFGTNLCAKTFKVRHDSHKKPLFFLRVFSGNLKKGQKVYNMRLNASEPVSKLFVATADDYTEVESVGPGIIVAASGFKSTQTGDLLTSSATAANSARKLCPLTESYNNMVLPDPVFFCSIECPSQAQQATLDRALAELSREDPSLHVKRDDETGQTVLGGMGELHLDVIKQRIREEYRVDVQLGPLQISYKEYLLSPVKDSFSMKLQIGSSQHSVTLTMSIEPQTSPPKDICLDHSPDTAQNISAIFPKHLVAIKTGALAALNRGPRLSCPVINVKITLHWFEVGRGTSESVISSAASQLVRKLLEAGGTQLLEPIMALEIACSKDVMPLVVADLNRRRVGHIDFFSRGGEKVLEAHVPLAELMGYSTYLRSVTSGQASFSMELHSLQRMSEIEEAKAIKAVTGLDPI